LHFKKGDVLELESEYPANGTGWGMARMNGESGLIPLNYVRPQDEQATLLGQDVIEDIQVT